MEGVDTFCLNGKWMTTTYVIAVMNIKQSTYSEWVPKKKVSWWNKRNNSVKNIRRLQFNALILSVLLLYFMINLLAQNNYINHNKNMDSSFVTCYNAIPI